MYHSEYMKYEDREINTPIILHFILDKGGKINLNPFTHTNTLNY